MIDVDLAIDRNQLSSAADTLTRKYLSAGKASVADTTKWLERELEALTRQAVPGRLWRAWGSAIYPKGSGISRNPVGEVFISGGTRSQGAMRFFSTPGRITGPEGGPVAIPLPAAGSRGKDRLLTPEEWEARHGVKLRPVKRPGKPMLLVVDEAVLSGRNQTARPNTARRRQSGRGSMTIPIFIILPAVDFANTVATQPLVERSGPRLAQDFVARVGRIG